MGLAFWALGDGMGWVKIREDGGRKKERTGSPHPGPLPSEWEREEERPPPPFGHLPRRPGGGEKTRLAEDGQAVAPFIGGLRLAL